MTFAFRGSTAIEETPRPLKAAAPIGWLQVLPPSVD
jgi:hypothetical protein